MNRLLASLVATATAIACLACGDDASPVADAGADVTIDSTLDASDSSVDAIEDAVVDTTADAPACASVCDGSFPVCLDGSCVACVPGATQCALADGGTVARTCDGTGTWQATVCAQPSPDCDAGACTCAGQVCNGTCIDVSSDGANCGRCDHDCCGGACVGGQCQIVTIASNQLAVSGVAVDSTDIYWVDDWGLGQVMKCSKTACTTPTTLASPQEYALRPVLDATSVYWITSNGAVRSCDKNGCASPTVLWAPASIQTPNNGSDLVVTGGSVYWTYDDKIFQCATNGCAGDAGAPNVIVSGQQTPSRIALDSTTVYWGEPFPTNTIEQCPLTGCGNAPTTFANAQRVEDIVVDATNVYWWSSQTGAVMSCPKSVCITPSVVTQGANSGIGQDDNYVYWFTNGSPSEMYACPKTGKCTLPLMVAPMTGLNSSSIVTDGACVYWGNSSQVLKVAKP